MNPGEPLSTRVPRMRAYNQLVHDLDAGGAGYAKDLSEVDVSDLENLRVRVNDPQGDVLVELGASDFWKRYQIYVSHVQEWRQQFQKLESVNLRYDNQVIVNPDMEGKPRPANLTAASVKAAAAAGVKPAALITHINAHDRSIPKPVFELSEKKLDAKSATAKKTAAKPKNKRVSVKPSSPAAKKPVAKHPVTPKANAAHASTNGTAAKPVHAARLAANAVSPKPSPAVAKPSAGSN